jgi:hypothetical protein
MEELKALKSAQESLKNRLKGNNLVTLITLIALMTR